MAELPQMVTELVDVSKKYLVQETVEPAKNIGKSLGFALGAAFCFGLGSLLLAIAVTRWAADALPEGVYWSALPYLIGAVLAILVIAVAMSRAQPDEPNGVPSDD